MQTQVVSVKTGFNSAQKMSWKSTAVVAERTDKKSRKEESGEEKTFFAGARDHGFVDLPDDPIEHVAIDEFGHGVPRVARLLVVQIHLLGVTTLAMTSRLRRRRRSEKGKEEMMKPWW